MAPKREKIKTYELDSEIADVASDAPILPNDGERQTSPTIDRIAPDHRARYEFAAGYLEGKSQDAGRSFNVLDACCGNGYGAYILATKALVAVNALDLSPAAVEFARFHYGHERINFEVGNLETCYLDSYDAIVCFEALEHLDATVVLERFRRALNPGGVLLVSVPNEENVPFTPGTHPFHLRHYTPAEFERLLTGWTIVERKHQIDKWGGEVKHEWGGRTLIVVASR